MFTYDSYESVTRLPGADCEKEWAALEWRGCHGTSENINPYFGSGVFVYVCSVLVVFRSIFPSGTLNLCACVFVLEPLQLMAAECSFG